MSNNKVKRVIGMGTLLACFSIAVVGLAEGQGKGRGPSQTSVIVEFQDFQVDPDRIQSDLLGPYEDGVDQVQAIIPGSGNLVMDTNTSRKKNKPAMRELFLDFTDPVDPDKVVFPLPFPGKISDQTGQIDVRLVTGCALGLLDMNAVSPSSQECTMSISFRDPQTDDFEWRLRFTGDATSFVEVTCVVGTKSSCSEWTIEALSADKANLSSRDTIKGRTVKTDHGNFFMPTHLTVTLKP